MVALSADALVEALKVLPDAKVLVVGQSAELVAHRILTRPGKFELLVRMDPFRDPDGWELR
jgi:hypothetical protein